MSEVTRYQTQELSKEDIQTLEQCQIIPLNTPPPIIKMFARICQEKGLSPFSKEIHLTKRKTKDGDKYPVITGIDGYRKQAEESGEYMGSENYLFDEGLTEYQMIEAGRKIPKSATCTVSKIKDGVQVKSSATAVWNEYYPGRGKKESFMWDSMPFNQLGKCAEAKALRKTFPKKLSGVYVDAEADRMVSKEEIELYAKLTGELKIRLKEFENLKELKTIAYDLRDEFKEQGLPANVCEDMINERIKEIKNA